MPDTPTPPDRPFEPFQPDNDHKWTTRFAGHLVRRAAFGASPERLKVAKDKGPGAAVDWLFDFDPHSDVGGLNAFLKQAAGLYDIRRSPEMVAEWWFHRMIHTPAPLQERIAVMWHDHFATGANKVGRSDWMHDQIELFRTDGLGSFRDLLIKVGRQPAMLRWLDGNDSRKEHPNENYGREVMELFTLGVGHYTEHDVQELARCFTGWTVTGGTDAKFNPDRFDDGEKELFIDQPWGKKGKFNDEAAVDVLLSHPQCAKYISWRLLSTFVHPTPTPEQIDFYAGRLTTNGWKIGDTLKEMFKSRLFFSDWAYRSQIKSPVDLVVGGSLAVGGTPRAEFLRRECAKMGQSLLYPPDVSGWHGGEAWISANTVMVRFRFGLDLAYQGFQEFADGPLYNDLNERGIKTSPRIVNYFADLLLDGANPRPTPAASSSTTLTATATTTPAEFEFDYTLLPRQGPRDDPAHDESMPQFSARLGWACKSHHLHDFTMLSEDDYAHPTETQPCPTITPAATCSRSASPACPRWSSAAPCRRSSVQVRLRPGRPRHRPSRRTTSSSSCRCPAATTASTPSCPSSTTSTKSSARDSPSRTVCTSFPTKSPSTPASSAFKKLYDDGMLGVIHGCGYPDANRSHFESMAIWHAAKTDGGDGSGWLGHYLDHLARGTQSKDIANGGGNRLNAVSIGREVPMALVSPTQTVPSVDSLDDFGLRFDDQSKLMTKNLEKQIIIELQKVPGRESGDGIPVSPSRRRHRFSADEIRSAAGKYRPEADYGNGLGQRLKLVAQLICGDFGTKVFYVEVGGFDTHANQAAAARKAPPAGRRQPSRRFTTIWAPRRSPTR